MLRITSGTVLVRRALTAALAGLSASAACGQSGAGPAGEASVAIPLTLPSVTYQVAAFDSTRLTISPAEVSYVIGDAPVQRVVAVQDALVTRDKQIGRAHV